MAEEELLREPISYLGIIMSGPFSSLQDIVAAIEKIITQHESVRKGYVTVRNNKLRIVNYQSRRDTDRKTGREYPESSGHWGGY